MPVYNCEASIALAIRSIVNQTFSNWELLVIDDGSNDRTVAIAQAFNDWRIRIVDDHTHKGLSFRLNQAIELSRGKYFARMDGDDVSYPDRLLLQVSYLDQHHEVDLLGGGMVVVNRQGQILGTRKVPLTHDEICRRPWAGFYLAHPTWMGKAEWFRRYLYRTDAVRCEDQDLLFRSYAESRFASIPEIILGYNEEALSVRKLLSGRRHFARSVMKQAISQQKYALAAVAVAEQTLKGVADCLAIATGLNYRILRHRALPVSESARERWHQVWECTVHQHDTSLVTS